MRHLVRLALVALCIVLLVGWVKRRIRAHSYRARATAACVAPQVVDAAPLPATVADPTPTASAEPMPAAILTDILEVDRVLARGTSTTFTRNLLVKHGATLRIEPGAKLQFASGTVLRIAGTLLAKGTEDAPIVMDTAEDETGTWHGIVFEDDVLSGSSLEWVVVRSGRDASALQFSTVTVQGPPRAVSITHSKIESATATALSVTTPLARFHDNTLDGSLSSLDIDADALWSIGPGNVFFMPIHATGRVTHDQSWPKVNVPIVITGTLSVDGLREPAVLTLADDTDLQFAARGQLNVGKMYTDGHGGALRARHVSMTNAPEFTSWSGVRFFDRAEGSSLDDCVIEGAQVGVVFHGTKKGVSVRNTTFLHVEHAVHSTSDRDCGALVIPSSGNRVFGGGLCRREPLPAGGAQDD